MSFSYVMREGMAGFRRARLSAFSSITAMMLAVILLGVLIRVSTNAYELAQALKQDVEVEIFLLDIGDNRTAEIKRELSNHEVVERVEYISRERAMELFREEFGAESELLGDVMFLPASFRVRTVADAQVSSIAAFADEMRDYRGVEEVRFNQRGLEILEERLHLFVIGGSLLGLFIGLTAMVLVFNTIRLTIYAKRDLIRAMKLVGATNGFIKRPFMVEGILQGLIAGGLGAGAVWAIFHILIPGYIPQAGVMSWPLGRWYYLTGFLVFLGLFLGFWGSRWAARKFINETTIGEKQPA
jgi:cell division transport system permease protein